MGAWSWLKIRLRRRVTKAYNTGKYSKSLRLGRISFRFFRDKVGLDVAARSALRLGAHGEASRLYRKADSLGLVLRDHVENHFTAELGRGNIVAAREILNSSGNREMISSKDAAISNASKGFIEGALATEEYDLALSLCEEMLAVNPENEYAMRQRAIICTRMRRHDDAAYFWSVWTNSDKASAEDWFRAARAHYNAKHFSEAISILERIRSGFGDEEKILDLMIRSRYSLMEWGLCYELCEEMLAINGRNASGLKYRRLTKLRQAGPKDVVTNIDEGVRSNLVTDVLGFSEAKRWFEYIN